MTAFEVIGFEFKKVLKDANWDYYFCYPYLAHVFFTKILACPVKEYIFLGST